jgi:hypothetical protein
MSAISIRRDATVPSTESHSVACLTESPVLNIKNKTHSVTAELVVPESGAEGVIIAQGGITGGWSLYAREGKPEYCYNFLGLERTYVEGTRTISSGTHQLRMEFEYDGGGLGKGGTVTLYVDGEESGRGRVERTEPIAFSTNEACDVGWEAGSPVTADYLSPGSQFSGEVNWIEIELDEALVDSDHEVTQAERLHLALAKP